MNTPKKTKENLSFEKAMERLDQIVSEMDSGNMPLDQLVERFEEGQALIQFCTSRLNDVEKKIEQITKRGTEIATSPLDDPSAD